LKKIRDPVVKAIETRISRGNRKLFLISLVEIFPEFIVFQYFEGLIRMCFIPLRRKR